MVKIEMKTMKIKNILKVGLFLAIAAVMTSCLDEDPYMDPNQSEGIIELFDISGIAVNPSGNALPHAYINAYDIVEAGRDFDMIISFSGAYDAPEDLDIQLVIDNSLLDRYNSENGTSYQILPEELYTTSGDNNWQVTIPEGEKRALINVTLDTWNFDPNITYVLPITIQSASAGTISGNFYQALYVMSAKNQYDGVYSLSFTQGGQGYVDRGWPVGTFAWPGDVYLITSGANTVDFFDQWGFGNYYHPLRTTTGWSGFGSAAPTLTIDPNTYEVTAISNYWGTPSNGRAFTFDDPGVTLDSYFDPETHNFYLQYAMTQPGYGSFIMTDTLYYEGSR